MRWNEKDGGRGELTTEERECIQKEKKNCKQRIDEVDVSLSNPQG